MKVRERVAQERRLRAMSARQAAAAGDISNTLWSKYEKHGIVTDAVRAGVARAFDWPMTWPEDPPADVSPSAGDALRSRLEELEAIVTEMQESRAEQDEATNDALRSLTQRVEALELREG